jgi:hypothetical protein
MEKASGRPERSAPGSFGRSVPDPEPKMAPVLNVGEVHAALRLSIDEESLKACGSQIASMVASATRQGFAAGFEVAMRDHGLEAPAVEPRPADGIDPDALRRAGA